MGSWDWQDLSGANLYGANLSGAALADAHRKGVLRRVGAAYQFRHELLREHLAHASDEPSAASPAISVTAAPGATASG